MSNLSSLQFFQLLRWGTLFLISILFAKSSFSVEEIGKWETFNFLISAVCFFWLSGLTQALLPLYGNSHTFRNQTFNNKKTSELYNVSIVFLIFGIFSAIILSVYFLFFSPPQDFTYILVVYVIISSTTYLVEYIYLLHNSPDKIILYGVVSFATLFLLVAIPICFHLSLYTCILCFSSVSIIRLIWFVVLSNPDSFT